MNISIAIWHLYNDKAKRSSITIVIPSLLFETGVIIHIGDVYTFLIA